ncbi:MAG: thiamine pyrophosphate-binding protein, partial [Cyanobacteria bacterium J06648_11]
MLQDMTLSEFLVHLLREVGTGHVFGVPGGALMPLHSAIEASPHLEFVCSRHECAAAYMADAYARVSGGLGVCAVTTGPGATNAITGLANARFDYSPLLLISAQVATAHIGKHAFQECSQMTHSITEASAPFALESLEIVDARTAPTQIRGLVERALRTPQGPVHLSVPFDLLGETVESSAA